MNEKNTPPSGPLSGIRILDLTRILAGPFCTQLFGDYGADVIKVEHPQKGDDTRAWGPPYVIGKDGHPTGESAYYLAANRNKYSIAVDLSSAQGADIIRSLLHSCDVLIENFKPGGLKKYGLDYDSLKDAYPQLVYCSISGFGHSGPNRHKPGYDLLAQAFGGIMSLTGEADGEPMKVGVAVSDIVCGLYAATAILAALHHRDQKGEGQHIDIALMDSQISWLVNEGTNFLLSGRTPKRRGNQHPNIVPYQVFAAADGYVIIAAGNDDQFKRLCDILSMPELAGHPHYRTNAARVTNREALIPILAQVIKKIDKNTLIQRMEDHNITGGVIQNLEEVFASDQVRARNMKISMEHPLAQSGTVSLIGNPVTFSQTPVTYRRPPPLCGQHTEEILRNFGKNKDK